MNTRLRAPGTMLAACVLGAFVVLAPTVVAIVTPGLVVLGCLALGVRTVASPRSDPVGHRWLIGWTIAAFAVHLVLGLVIWSMPSLVSYLGGDALLYQHGAAGIVQHWTAGASMPPLPTGKKGFFYVLAALYYALGTHAQAGIVLNAGLAAGVLPLLYDVTRRRFGIAAARYAPPLALVLPGFLIWGSQLLREPGVYFCLALGLACSARLAEHFSLPATAGLVAALVVLVTFRADVGLLAAGGFAIALALGRREAVSGLVTGIGAAGIVLALVVGAGLGYGGYHLVTHASLQQINAVRSNSSAGAASGFLGSASVATPGSAIAYLPLGMTELLLGPFPWQVHSLRELPAIPDAVTWWALLPSLWSGLRIAARRHGRGMLLEVLPALLLAVGISLIIANFGTAVRERMQVIVLLVPVVAAGLAARSGQAALRRAPRHSSARGDRRRTDARRSAI